MQMDVNCFDRQVKRPDELPTVGIVLCRRKNDALVELNLPQDATCFASKHPLDLPSKEELKVRLEQITHDLNGSPNAMNPGDNQTAPRSPLSRRFGKKRRTQDRVAGHLLAKTSVTNEWISNTLGMGHPGSVSRMLSAGRADKDLAMKRKALTQILFPDEHSTPMNSLDVNARGPTRMVRGLARMVLHHNWLNCRLRDQSKNAELTAMKAPAIVVWFAMLSATIAQVDSERFDPSRPNKYQRRGLSLDGPTDPGATNPTPMALREVPQDSKKFQSILALLQKQHSNMTQESLTERLKNGESFTVIVLAPPATCTTCLGAGKLADAKAKTPDKKTVCAECKGTGKKSTRTYYRIWWVVPAR